MAQDTNQGEEIKIKDEELKKVIQKFSVGRTQSWGGKMPLK